MFHYNGQKIAVLDDYRKSDLPHMNNLFKLLDRREITVKTFQGTALWIPEVIIITSVQTPWEMYNTTYIDRQGKQQDAHSEEDLTQLYRRIDRLITFSIAPDGTRIIEDHTHRLPNRDLAAQRWVKPDDSEICTQLKILIGSIPADIFNETE